MYPVKIVEIAELMRQFFRQQYEKSQIKQFKIGFIRVVWMYLGKWYAFRYYQGTVRTENDRLMDSEVGWKVIGVKHPSQMKSDSV